MTAVPGRPTVEEVALLIRARTKDSNGHEVGTFDDDTRPTGDEVELQIDAAFSLVCTRLPALHTLDTSLLPAVVSLVAYRAALRIEKSYFPEQVRTDRSAYDQLYAEYTDDLAALVDTIAEGGGAEITGGRDFGSVKVGSWTSIPGTVP